MGAVGKTQESESLPSASDQITPEELQQRMYRLLQQLIVLGDAYQVPNPLSLDQRLALRALDLELDANTAKMPLTHQQSRNLNRAKRLLALVGTDVESEANKATTEQAILLAASAFKARKQLDQDMPWWLFVSGVALSVGLSTAMFFTTFYGTLQITTDPESRFYQEVSINLTIYLGVMFALNSMAANWISTRVGTPKGLTRYLTNKRKEAENLYTPRALFAFILSGAMGWIMYDITSYRMGKLPDVLNQLLLEDLHPWLRWLPNLKLIIEPIAWLANFLSFMAFFLAFATAAVYFTIDGSCNDDLIRGMTKPTNALSCRSIAKSVGALFTLGGTIWISFDGYRCAAEKGADPYWNTVKMVISILAETGLYFMSGFMAVDNFSNWLTSRTDPGTYVELKEDVGTVNEIELSYHQIDMALQPQFTWRDLPPAIAVSLNGLCNVIIFLGGLMEWFRGLLGPILISAGIFWNSATVCRMFLNNAVPPEDVKAVQSRAELLRTQGTFSAVNASTTTSRSTSPTITNGPDDCIENHVVGNGPRNNVQTLP